MYLFFSFAQSVHRFSSQVDEGRGEVVVLRVGALALMPPQCDVGAASFIGEIVASAPIDLVESEVPFAVCLLLCQQRPLSLADLQMRQ